MTTYTVFNLEEEDPGDRAGMTLEQAVERLLSMAGCGFGWRRADGMTVMDVTPMPWPSRPLELYSGLADDAAARAEIMQRFVTGEILLPGSWCIERDDVFGAEMARAAS